MSWDTARAAVGDVRREPTFPSPSSTHSAGLSRRSGLSLAGAEQQLPPCQRLQKGKRGINENVSTLPTKEHSRSFLLSILNVLLLSPTQH